MTATTETSFAPHAYRAEKAITLALRLAHAENALLTLTSGQVDAIVAPTGQTYLLRHAQEHLRQSERRLQALINSAADVITVVNRGGVILSQSAAVSRVLGYEPTELVGTSIFHLVHEDDVARLHAAFFNVIEGVHEHATAPFRHQDRDGSYRLIEATVGKLADDSAASVVFSLRPSTSSPRTFARPAVREVALSKVMPPKDRFLAMLSHELRTPLSPILLGLEELQEDARFAEALPGLEMIRRNVHLLSRLLEELTDFTAVETHKVRLHPATLDVHKVIGFVLEICRSEIAAAQIEVLLYLRADESVVRADEVRLQQVMWNLVKNAVKFSTPGSSISIATINNPPGWLTIEFADHGIGITAALLPLVFEPFAQGDGHLYGGLGLGMFIAKGLVEAQGGTLTAASEGVGKGATFLLALPTEPRPEVEPTDEETPDRVGGNGIAYG